MIEGRPLPSDYKPLWKIFDGINITITFYHSEELPGYSMLIELPNRTINTDIATLNCKFFDFSLRKHIPNTNYYKLHPELLSYINQRWFEFYLMFDPYNNLARYEYHVRPLRLGARVMEWVGNRWRLYDRDLQH